MTVVVVVVVRVMVVVVVAEQGDTFDVLKMPVSEAVAVRTYFNVYKLVFRLLNLVKMSAGREEEDDEEEEEEKEEEGEERTRGRTKLAVGRGRISG
ncbi:hypothetical protein E2C01_042258 [Portunus trituberculatus]|uniref:Secreted protein n=1 Tax=Portunus trituberculatus TaxID=210409 RepID=A0A5B7FT58_PORTR|nr:hypothetical protein [Portunus trituberculatus]